MDNLNIMTKKKTNPNGANQHKPDPRQTLFLANYFDPKSETFANCRQSALKAGYEEKYADVIVSNMPTWLSNNIKDDYLIAKAEENLKKFLENDKDPLRQSDITKFTLERLNKKKYSPRSEVTADINMNPFQGLVDEIKKEVTDAKTIPAKVEGDKGQVAEDVS